MGRDPVPDVQSLTFGLKDQNLDDVTPDETGGQDARAPTGMGDGSTSVEGRVVLRQGDTGLKASRQDARAPGAEGRQGACGPSRHIAHMLVSCSLYAALYSVALVLEISYEFDRFGSPALKIAPFVFGWMMISSLAGLTIDRELTSKDQAGGLAASAATFLIAAAVLFAALTRFLPSFPITQSTALQTYPAQAAYLKDVSYFLALGFCFLIVPFHFIVTVERDYAGGRHDQVFGLLTGSKMISSPKGTTYPRFWALAPLLVVLAAFSLVMTSRLLDHSKTGPYSNLFAQLVYLRGILYFGLGIWCLIWYHQAIDEAKRVMSHE